jgi:uncharacterized protein (DUF58 family)
MTPELLKTLRRIQFHTTHLAKDVLAGAYRSAFKGKGMEFEEVREYQSGDEIRSIDWNVTARMNHPYVKTFREERELSVNLVVDMSSSCRFGSHQEIKGQLIAEVGALLAFSAIRNSDKLGLILFSDQIEKYVPPGKTQRHILRIIRDILAYKPKHPRTDINKALNFFGNLRAKSSICFLISDFLCDDFSHEALLISKHHDLIAISVRDPFEFELPDFNLVSLKDFETGECDIFDFSNFNLREAYKKSANGGLQDLKHLMQKIGAGFIDIRTDKPYLPVLQQYFLARGQQRR